VPSVLAYDRFGLNRAGAIWLEPVLRDCSDWTHAPSISSSRRPCLVCAVVQPHWVRARVVPDCVRCNSRIVTSSPAGSDLSLADVLSAAARSGTDFGPMTEALRGRSELCAITTRSTLELCVYTAEIPRAAHEELSSVRATGGSAGSGAEPCRTGRAVGRSDSLGTIHTVAGYGTLGTCAYTRVSTLATSATLSFTPPRLDKFTSTVSAVLPANPSGIPWVEWDYE
jgi:hypothetical protein